MLTDSSGQLPKGSSMVRPLSDIVSEDRASLEFLISETGAKAAKISPEDASSTMKPLSISMMPSMVRPSRTLFFFTGIHLSFIKLNRK